MRVELALFDGNALLSRDKIRIGRAPQTEKLSLFQADHKLGEMVADIVFSRFAKPIALKTVTLDMPIHESDDWESIELGKYTLAFWCRLDA